MVPEKYIYNKNLFFSLPCLLQCSGDCRKPEPDRKKKKKKRKKKGVEGGGCEKNKATLTILIGSRAGFSTVSWDGLVFLPVVLLGFCPLP